VRRLPHVQRRKGARHSDASTVELDDVHGVRDWSRSPDRSLPRFRHDTRSIGRSQERIASRVRRFTAARRCRPRSRAPCAAGLSAEHPDTITIGRNEVRRPRWPGPLGVRTGPLDPVGRRPYVTMSSSGDASTPSASVNAAAIMPCLIPRSAALSGKSLPIL
jgi:hypothetical protein